LQLRTPKFREDQFRDLFNQETPQPRTQPSPQPSPTPIVNPTPVTTPNPSATSTPTPTPTAEAKKDEKKTEIIFENIRRRLSIMPTGVNVNEQVISPDGKTVLILASAENQFNLYTMPLDELATDQSAKQITSTSNFKSDAQFSPDSKEVFYIENGRINVVIWERTAVRPLAVTN
jgi:dipeptidyl aminopeptidase/acylaminoacyl peptidase